MNRWAGRLFSMVLAAVSARASGQTILWNSDANAVNLTSAGQPMDAGFCFELGVFSGSFVPTSANREDWAAHWNVALRTPYDAVNKRYSNAFTPADNDFEFGIGKTTYVWGFRGDALSGEWILFRAPSWIFPEANPPVPPSPIEWFAKDATPVLGSIHPGGAPFLMKSAAVTHAAPPDTTWSQWQVENLTNEPLDGPGDDPDSDGTPNLLEFVFGTPPRTAGVSTATPVVLVDGHLQITIPRRIDHPADLTVEVSGDLTQWFSGPAHTMVVSDGLTALVVSDLTPLDAAHPWRFMRLRASVTPP